MAPSSSFVRASRSRPSATTAGSQRAISSAPIDASCARPCVERLGAVGERVHRGADRLLAREVERECRLVDDGDRVGARAARLRAACLVAHPEIGRPLRAGVRRRHRDHGQARCGRHRLGGVDRASAADRDEAVCLATQRRSPPRPPRRARAAARRRSDRQPEPRARRSARSSRGAAARARAPRATARARRDPSGRSRGQQLARKCDERVRYSRTRASRRRRERDLAGRVETFDPSFGEPACREVGLDRGT